jgi:neutral ceramidase
MKKVRRVFTWASCLSVCLLGLDHASAAEWKVGVARVDVTPDYAVRLSGYGSRTKEVSEVKLRLHAKALALQWAEDKPAVIVTVDNCGIPATVRAEVLKRVNAAGKALAPERFAICSSHTHSAPHVRGYLPLIFGGTLTKEEEGRIDRYTAEITEKLAQAVLSALASLKPGSLSHNTGKVGFAMNRRLLNREKNEYANSPNPVGPVDHALPVLRVKDASGKIIAVFTSYACHCTTLAFDTMHGDWAGEAQREMELRLPGVVAMTAIGCGGDQNPYPRREYEFARQHGIALSDEAIRVVNGDMAGVKGPLDCAVKGTSLPMDAVPAKEEWMKRTADTNRFIAAQARYFIERLNRGEKIADRVPYEVQCWDFGGALLMLNLPGEVVVDYSLRLKKTYGAERTWVNAYTNDVPCYIPSQRVWEEGGYEAAGAMVYYGWPTRLASGIEEMIFKSLSEIVPGSYEK